MRCYKNPYSNKRVSNHLKERIESFLSTSVKETVAEKVPATAKAKVYTGQLGKAFYLISCENIVSGTHGIKNRSSADHIFKLFGPSTPSNKCTFLTTDFTDLVSR